MGWLIQFFRSSLGLKYLMGLTGAGIYGFFIVHILGNLTVFAGQDAMNAYALSLKTLPFGLLWVARIGLIVIFAVHIFSAIKLTAANKAARPQAYAKPNTIQASLASRTMALSGLLILSYLIFHLAHFTWRIVAYDGPLVDAQGRDDVYTMVVEAFQEPLLALLYIVAMIIVGFHLKHGSQSMFQSLGLNHPKYNKIIKIAPPALGWLIAVAGISIPVAIFVGIVS